MVWNEPGGALLGEVVAARELPLQLLETRGAWARIRLVGEVEVEGWTDDARLLARVRERSELWGSPRRLRPVGILLPGALVRQVDRRGDSVEVRLIDPSARVDVSGWLERRFLTAGADEIPSADLDLGPADGWTARATPLWSTALGPIVAQLRAGAAVIVGEGRAERGWVPVRVPVGDRAVVEGVVPGEALSAEPPPARAEPGGSGYVPVGPWLMSARADAGLRCEPREDAPVLGRLDLGVRLEQLDAESEPGFVQVRLIDPVIATGWMAAEDVIPALP